MPLLFETDYQYLGGIDLDYVEDEASRFLILKKFLLPPGVYRANGHPRAAVDVLYVVPPNYNVEGGDMFWVNPQLERIDGKPIPNISGPGQDSRTHNEVEYMRWSRHWNNRPWRPKVDNIQMIVDRITWAFKHPDAER